MNNKFLCKLTKTAAAVSFKIKDIILALFEFYYNVLSIRYIVLLSVACFELLYCGGFYKQIYTKYTRDTV